MSATEGRPARIITESVLLAPATIGLFDNIESPDSIKTVQAFFVRAFTCCSFQRLSFGFRRLFVRFLN